MNNQKLTLLFDGGCPLCLREFNFLSKKDKLNLIKFIDINDKSYSPKLYKNISYSNAMKTIHAINENDEVVNGLEVFRLAYKLIGLGWIYAPTKLPIISNIADFIYDLWAKNRLFLTGRSLSSCDCE